MGFGRKTPKGSLPVFSVADEEEAKLLVVSACPRSVNGEYFAPELVAAQTLENLAAFSHRLAEVHDRLRAAGNCRCAT